MDDGLTADQLELAVAEVRDRAELAEAEARIAVGDYAALRAALVGLKSHLEDRQRCAHTEGTANAYAYCVHRVDALLHGLTP